MQNNNSNNQSLDFQPEESIHLEMPNKNIFSKNLKGLKNFMSKGQQNVVSKYVNVLNSQKGSQKFVLNSKFEEVLALNNSNPMLVTVSFLGPKKIGKSFLLDNILTHETNSICRIMSKNNGQLVNYPLVTISNSENMNIAFLDNNGEVNPFVFLWLYLTSSVMIYNLNPNNENEEKNLLECINYAYNAIKSAVSDFSKPFLLVVRRDVYKADIMDLQLMRQIQKFQLFADDIHFFHLPYPGKQNVKTKELIDVPEAQLNAQFIDQTKKIAKFIKTASCKRIQSYSLNTQVFNFMLKPLTNAINNQESISGRKIMNNVNETIAIWYYNNYLKCYSEELERQFSNEEPCDKYNMYKKLAQVKRRTNKKMDRFKYITGDSIFQKYREKLEDAIKSKQNLVKGVNQSKSREVHQKNYKNLTEKLNSNNFEELIDKYCKSTLDDQKIQVLIENLDHIVQEKDPQIELDVKETKKKKEKVPPPPELKEYEKQLEEINKALLTRTSIIAKKPAGVNELKAEIERKKRELQKLKQQKEELEKQPAPDFKAEKGRNSNLQLELKQMQEEKQKLKENEKNLEKEIQDLQALRERKIKEETEKLKSELRQQEKEISQLKANVPKPLPLRSKLILNPESTKKTCCTIM